MHIINCVTCTAVSLAVSVLYTYFWYFMDMLHTDKAFNKVMVKGNICFKFSFPVITKH